MEKKIENLIAFCQGIHNKENGKVLYDKYLADIRQVTPQDVFLVQNEQMKLGAAPEQMLLFVDKLINAFYESLSAYRWDKPASGSFLYYLMAENKALLAVLNDFKAVIKADDTSEIKREKSRHFVEKLSEYNAHLLKLENILFPYMEKKKPRYEGLKIMWALHDQMRAALKETAALLDDSGCTGQDLNIALGTLFFDMSGLVQKQELIMFPAAAGLFTDEEFSAMHIQSFDYEFAYIDRPEKPNVRLQDIVPGGGEKGVLHTPTGSLTHAQIEALINTLPVDVTFVDENDKVAFFSRPKERLFPRSSAVIGRDVRNCHPPQSVHVVEEILDSFRTGTKDTASFWIKLKGLFVLIQYFALRNDAGDYMGTLEVSQEISEIRSLEGEKKLLD